MMRSDMYEGRWSPFDPEWYQQAFDKFISTADQLFNQDEIIAQGYRLPDSDGSKSSVFRRNAVLNNSFNEKALRETLKDIYLNSHHKLTANNHDNVHFFKWNGHMSDVNFIPNTNLCEVKIPSDSFIADKSRDRYKLSQFYRKWIDITDILNNWDVFKWDCMLFINQRIYSEYQIRIDDQETTIRFRYEDFWVSNNYSIFIYKFDTKSQCRIKVSQELLKNQLKWKLPLEYITDKRILNSTHVIIAFNKISDQSIRTDGVTTADVMGDNLEFLKIEDGIIDLSKISDFNNRLIRSEASQWLLMSIIVPKFFHEYPILLPTDVIYRPYQADMVPVFTSADGEHDVVQVDKSISDSGKTVYINRDTSGDSWNDGWKYVVRPIVLADAFDEQDRDPYDAIVAELDELRDLTVQGADIIESFRKFISNYTTDDEFSEYCDKLESMMKAIAEHHNTFLANRRINQNEEYNSLYEDFVKLMPIIRAEKDSSLWFHREHGKDMDFWSYISPLIYVPRDLVDRYNVSVMLKHIGSSTIWEDASSYYGKNRFRRPVDAMDFWMFEYDMENNVWRPCVMEVTHHFPDVYTIKDPNEDTPTPNRIFKAFFFYSDTPNVREQSGDIVRATPDWSRDMEEYELEKGSSYRDIFMEKFYWMGVRSIYKGLIVSRYRWEVIEYIQDNVSYKRFNELFLNTMDPYFKMGLATYLKSSNFEFPFDDAIEKMNERINSSFLGYKRVTNFEMYLNKTWVPSYFDYITKIMDDWDWSNRLIRRPRNTFDTGRLLPTLMNTQSEVHSLASELNNEIEWILRRIYESGFDIENVYLKKLAELTKEFEDNIDAVYKFTCDLDLEIYSIDDVNQIVSMLKKHGELVDSISRQFSLVFQNGPNGSAYEEKRNIVSGMINTIRHELCNCINTMGEMVQSFSIEDFMKHINDPEFLNERDHADDSSLIGVINNFKTPWPDYVKEARNKVYVSTTSLWAAYDTTKSYSAAEIESFSEIVDDVKRYINDLGDAIYRSWDELGSGYDENLVNLIEYARENIDLLSSNVELYCKSRNELMQLIDDMRSVMISTEPLGISDTEENYISSIDEKFDTIITNLSYIAGSNNINGALEENEDILQLSNEWLTYINAEIDIFNRMAKLSGQPNSFLDNLAPYNELLLAMIEYMESVDREFIPDSQLPDYSNVYSVDEIEILTKGFMHKVGDDVFIPNLGSYKITSVEGNVAKASSIEKYSYRNTVFRNPCWQSNPYDSITSGNGMGISVRPISASRTKIINDSVVKPYKDRIENIVYMIKRDVDIINPYNNKMVTDTIASIKSVQDDWEDISSFYSEYMTEDVSMLCSAMINSTNDVLDSLTRLIEARSDNDFNGFLILFENFIVESYKAFESRRMISPNYIYFDNRMRVAYTTGIEFYGNGTAWNDKHTLLEVLATSVYEIKLFYRKMLISLEESDDKVKLEEEYEDLITKVDSIRNALNEIEVVQEQIIEIVGEIEDTISNMPEDLHKDVWYNLKHASVGAEGSGYSVGDIVEIVPELPTDITGNPIYDQEDIVLNDVILMQVTQVNETGGVIKVEPLMDYAIPYLIWGSRNTITRVGSGDGLVISAYSYEITINDNKLFLDKSSYIEETARFDQNDLFTFKFENIHDLDIQYEVFYAGKQIRDFVVRHESDNNPLHPRNVDVIYLKANDVMDLRNSSIYMEGEHYFVYRLDNIEIIDPGAGYAAGQEIVIDADQLALHLKVAKLMSDPLKGISAIQMLNNQRLFNGSDPTSDYAKAIPDSLNNIDDEFNTGYYDRLTSEGTKKGATVSLDPEQYPFTSKRFDDREDGDRNKVFMYPDVDMPDNDDVPKNGDPDTHVYLGSRINSEKMWNGIMNTVSPSDPFIPDESRVPTGKPIKGEYQSINDSRIHNSEVDMMDSISDERISKLLNGADVVGNGSYIIHGKEFDGIPMEDIEDMFNWTYVPHGVPSVEVDGEIIRAVDVSKIRSLVYGDIIGSKNPGPFVDECIINRNPASKTEVALWNKSMVTADKTVETYASLPKHINEWPDVAVGKTVIVECDETNNGHRMLYRLRTFVVSGYLVYDIPEMADYKWNHFDVDWMNTDFYPDLPTLKAQYPSEKWMSNPSFVSVQRDISDGNIERVVTPIAHKGTYIHDVTVDDLSVFNFTTFRWEDLHDENRWKLEVRNSDEEGYGFRLVFLEDGNYSYNMRLFLNKIPETQLKNACLKRDAVFRIAASINSEVNTRTTNISVNTGRHLRIRKLFPYEQKESFTIGKDEDGKPIGYEMDFKLANYLHFKNEIHLEDIKIYNKTAGRFEDLLNPNMFEVRFRDERAVARGYETQTSIVQSMIASAGEGFTDGEVWGWNEEFGIHIFGRVTADFMNDGSLLSFIPVHCPNPPEDDIALEFEIFQYSTQRESQEARVIIEFQTQRLEVYGDGYLHNVTNRMAPVPREFKVICQYNLDEPTEYDIIISKTSRTWSFVEPRWMVFPTFHLPDYNVQQDRLYVMTDKGRFPLINPSTNKPSINVTEGENGTDVTFLNLYNKYEHLEIHSVPYPMRSVYVQRRVPSNGYIDLKGKINKPLNKKYFEFWMNGRLLYDEVTIISPTKIFLHGLKSLRNFEIIEVNRDPNEYFSDNFLEAEAEEYGRPYPVWNFKTYLDGALTGTLEGDNYTIDEQSHLLSPVWKQVEREHPEYKNYPPNQDLEADILLRVDDYADMSDIAMPAYQFTVLDVPTIEGIPVSGRTLNFDQFGFLPITSSMIISMLNEEWDEEIKDGKIPLHSIVSDDDWYGLAARLYDEYGVLVHTLNEAAYKVVDTNMLRINTKSKTGRIIRNSVSYDLD